MRSSTTLLDEVFRDLLQAHLIDGTDAPPNFSVAYAPSDGRRSGYSFLFERSRPILRTRSPRRLVTGLLRHLDSYAREPSPHLLEVRGLALVSGTGAVIVPADLRRSLDRLEPRLRRADIRILDDMAVRIDPAAGQLVVDSLRLAVNWDALTGLEAAMPEPRRPEPLVAPGRYALRGWWIRELPEDATLATCVANVAPQVGNTAALGGQRVLDLTAAGVQAVRPTPLPRADARGVAAGVAAVLGSG